MIQRYSFLALAILIVAFVVQTPVHAQDPPPNMSMGRVVFTSHPTEVGRVGIPYVYTTHAIALDSSAVHYVSAPTNPPGFSIDSISGVVTWTPAARGWYTIAIGAISAHGDRGGQQFTVTVTSGSGVIQGKVTDTLNVGIPQVIIEILQATGTDPAGPGCYMYTTRTGPNGNYRVSGIDSGRYKIHAISPSPHYASQWYDGKATPAEADWVLARNLDTTIVNVTLRGGPTQMPRLTVTGAVTDTLGNPLGTARVWFVRAGFALNSNADIDDFRRFFDLNAPSTDCRLDGRSEHVFPAEVDPTGHYVVLVPPGVYIAFAKARGYAIDFYDGQSDFLSATRLLIVRDTSGINFAMTPLPPITFGSISGAVLDTAKGVGVRSRIIAWRDRWITPVASYRAIRGYMVDTDSLGAYTIDSMVTGWYYVLAIPLGNYAPAFYVSGNATTALVRASRVWVNGNAVTGIDIYVRPFPPSMGGFTGFSGAVTLNNTQPLPPGALVYAFRDGAIAGYGVVDAGGQYSINGLAPGTYSVMVDRPGYVPATPQSGTISYSGSGAPISATLNFSMTAVTGVAPTPSAQPATFALGQNYPNPFNPSTTISYALPVSGNVSLKVFNLLGQEVASLVNGFQNAGSHTINFTAHGMASGVYFYRLQSQGEMVTRRMILLQ